MDPRASAREPARTCVVCRRARPRSELVRFVRRPDGTVGLDAEGKAPGRGAYVCPEEMCVRRAAKRLAGALRAPAAVERIDEELRNVGVA